MKRDIELSPQVQMTAERWRVASGRDFFDSRIAAQRALLKGILELPEDERASGQLEDVQTKISQISAHRDGLSEIELVFYGVFHKGPKEVTSRLGKIASFLNLNPDKEPSEGGIALIHKMTDCLDLLPGEHEQFLGGAVVDYFEAVDNHPFFAKQQTLRADPPSLHPSDGDGHIIYQKPKTPEKVKTQQTEVERWLVEVVDSVGRSEHPVHISELVQIAYGDSFIPREKFEQLKKDLATCPNLRRQPGGHFSLAETPDHPFLTQLWSVENTVRISAAVLDAISVGDSRFTRLASQVIETDDEKTPENEMRRRHLKQTLGDMVRQGALVKTKNVYSRANQKGERPEDSIGETDGMLTERIHESLGSTNNPRMPRVSTINPSKKTKSVKMR